jgi:hypothetical protein
MFRKLWARLNEPLDYDELEPLERVTECVLIFLLLAGMGFGVFKGGRWFLDRLSSETAVNQVEEKAPVPDDLPAPKAHCNMVWATEGDADDDGAVHLAGVYFMRIRAGGQVAVAILVACTDLDVPAGKAGFIRLTYQDGTIWTSPPMEPMRSQATGPRFWALYELMPTRDPGMIRVAFLIDGQELAAGRWRAE